MDNNQLDTSQSPGDCLAGQRRKQMGVLGCRVVDQDGWHCAESNGIIYAQDEKIVAECESDDLEVTHWHALPTSNKPL